MLTKSADGALKKGRLLKEEVARWMEEASIEGKEVTHAKQEQQKLPAFSSTRHAEGRIAGAAMRPDRGETVKTRAPMGALVQDIFRMLGLKLAQEAFERWSHQDSIHRRQHHRHLLAAAKLR